MTRPGIALRLVKLEQTSSEGVPLWIRNWFGETLTLADRDRAREQWEAVHAPPALDPATFPRELREWLAER